MKRFWIWFQSLSRFNQIGISVLTVHVGVLLALLINHVTEERLKPKKPITIRTVFAQESKKAAPEMKKKGLTVEKKKTKTASPAASSPKKEMASLKKNSREKEGVNESEFLLKIAESLALITETSKTTSQPKFTPDLPPSIDIHTSQKTPSSNSPGYSETVSAILQNCLALPEFGEVIAKIGIDPSGKVTECEILETRSRKNAEFLKKRLQELAFPCFNEFGLSDPHLIFTITFRNVENR